ncbi:hypothetical protein MASR2M39_31490 [Ignavibacteriales bacterium]
MAVLTRGDLEIQGFFVGKSIPHYLISDLPGGRLKNVKEVGIGLSRGENFEYSPGKTAFDKPLSINQLRKFYYKFQQICEQKGEFEQKKINLLMFKANIEYSANRLDTRRFAIMMHNRIKLIVESPNEAEFTKNLEAFSRNFEALVAYYPTKK